MLLPQVWADAEAEFAAGGSGERWATPGQLAVALDPRTVQTPALDLIDAALVDVDEGRRDRLIITTPPQEGKSTRVTTMGPLWMLRRNPDLRIAIVSYGQDLADEFGRNIRNLIQSNSGDEGSIDLGLRIAPDNGAARRWRIAGRLGGIRSVGIGAGLTGRPADRLFIDDPIKDAKQADSPTWRESVWKFWQSVGNTRLAPGAPVVIVLTRWHEDDLVGRLLAAEDGHRWQVINIPAQADHDPNKGQVDVLGREPGVYLDSARGRTVVQWEQIKTASGERVWTALYQGHPSPGVGMIFRREWWKYYDIPQWVDEADGSCWALSFDEVIQSWDMAFKDTDGSDYVVGQVWGRRGVDAFLLDQVRGRFSFVETCNRMRALSAKWPQASAKLIEDKANGPAVISQLRSTVGGLIAVEPDGSKLARASAVSPFVQAGNVWLPAVELAPWIDGYIEEHAAFPLAAHDDQVDTTSQALNRILLSAVRPRVRWM